MDTTFATHQVTVREQVKDILDSLSATQKYAKPAPLFLATTYLNVHYGLMHAVEAIAIGLFVGVITTAVVAAKLASAPAFLAGAVAFLTPHLAVPLAALGLSTASAAALSTGLIVGASVALLLLIALITYMVIDLTLVGMRCAARAATQKDNAYDPI